MSRNSILRKLRQELAQEVTTERQVVYILAEIRKAIEQAGELKNYYALDFYCSFALHTRMDRAGAQRILQRFDKAYPLLAKKQALPPELRREIQQTIKLERFSRELETFLTANNLPTRLFTEPDGWAKFIHHYGNVIDECELVIKGDGAKLKSIDRVTVRLETATKTLDTSFGSELLFRLRWISHGKDGTSGEHFVIFGFDLPPKAKKHPKRRRLTKASRSLRKVG
jgi:hypothetical protein